MPRRRRNSRRRNGRCIQDEEHTHVAASSTMLLLEESNEDKTPALASESCHPDSVCPGNDPKSPELDSENSHSGYEQSTDKDYEKARAAVKNLEELTKENKDKCMSEEEIFQHCLGHTNDTSPDNIPETESSSSGYENPADKIYDGVKSVCEEKEKKRVLRKYAETRGKNVGETDPATINEMFQSSCGTSAGSEESILRSRNSLLNSLREISELDDNVLRERSKRRPRGKSSDRAAEKRKRVRAGTSSVSPPQPPEIITLPSDSDVEVLELSPNHPYHDDDSDLEIIEVKINSRKGASSFKITNLTEYKKYNETVLTIKISWKLGPVKEFHLRKFQKFKTIHEYYSSLEDVPVERIFLHGGKESWKSIEPYDTPDSIGFQSDHILEGGVLPNSSAKKWVVSERFTHHLDLEKNEIEVKVLQEKQRSFPVRLKTNEKLIILYIKVSEQIETNCDKITIQFDGEIIDPNLLSTDIDLENGDAVDLIIKN